MAFNITMDACSRRGQGAAVSGGVLPPTAGVGVATPDNQPISASVRSSDFTAEVMASSDWKSWQGQLEQRARRLDFALGVTTEEVGGSFPAIMCVHDSNALQAGRVWQTNRQYPATGWGPMATPDLLEALFCWVNVGVTEKNAVAKSSALDRKAKSKVSEL